MKYTLGVDVGIASIGFAGVNILSQSIPFCGVHIFEAAENPKDGASLAAPRREKRGMRRVISRRAQRKKALRCLFRRHGFGNVDAAIDAAPFAPPEKSVWDLRKEALERLLTEGEFIRVLFHIAKRRGFQSNRKGGEDNDTEGKKALSGARELQEAMRAAAAPTIGAYLATLDKKRNGDGSYERFVTRELLREEVRKIFEAQARFGNAKATPELLTDYAGSGKKEERNTPEGDGIAFYQRPLRSSEDLVGFCTLEPAEKRAPRFSYTAELFVLWSKLNNTRIRNVDGRERELTLDEKNRLAEKAHMLKSLSYKQARKDLGLQDEERFNLSYRKISEEDNTWEKIRDAAEKADFLKLPGYHALKGVLGAGGDMAWQKWTTESGRKKLDEVARILSFYEDRKEVDALLAALDIDFQQREELAKITHFSKVVDLSLKAIRNILPHMQQGLTYDKACDAAGYSRKQNKKLKKVPVFEDVRNPVVNRALAQARKVINACIREYDMPESIIVEMSRDLGRSFKDRKNIEREQKKNQAYREEARHHIAEIIGVVPENVSGEEILKYRLWKEQKALCCYCGSEITPAMLKDAVATQIDHILPYSRSWNDSYMNKVICHTSCNQEKANRTPYEWLAGTPGWESVVLFARQLPPRKAEHLLMQNFDDEKAGQWKDRALNDTRYIAKLLKNHLENSLDLGDGVRVQTRNGALTANLRRAWGLGKRRDNDRHHAVDAIVLACSTQAMVQQHANWNKYEARRKNPAARPAPPSPWENFRQDVMNKVFGEKNAQGIREGGIFVSRMPVRKVTGAAHEETIRSIRKSDGKAIQRVKLSALTPARLEDIVDKERNIKLYSVLKERLDAHGGKPDKAFAEPVYMPTNDPAKKGPRINSVRVVTNEKSGVPINGGLASNGDMVRVDVFLKEGKYYLVPIYVHHFAQDKLPNKAIVANKPEDEWPEMDDRDFIFSLYKNDLVMIRSKKEEFWGYYAGTDRSVASISIKCHDADKSVWNSGQKTGIGVKTLLSFEKYSVDYFGNIFPKHSPGIREKRRGVAQRDDSKSGAAEPVQRAAATGE